MSHGRFERMRSNAGEKSITPMIPLDSSTSAQDLEDAQREGVQMGGQKTCMRGRAQSTQKSLTCGSSDA